ncbi:MAG: DNA primase [Acidobacteriia bacterium]|nr:DNA primase [Terriglobia bacterium]
MRLKADFSDNVKMNVDIVRIVSDYVKLKRSGANYKGLCPFHNEKTPSFHVHSTRQMFHCFGCGVGGDVFKFVMLIDRATFPEAVKAVAEKAGIPVQEEPNLRAEDDPTSRLRKELYRLNEFAMNFFFEQLGSGAEGAAAREYLSGRGVSREAIEKFKIGYAPQSGDALYRKLQAAFGNSEALEASGLIVRRDDGSGFFDRFRRRVMFPIFRENGSVVAFGGRILGEGQPKYLNSPESPVYSKSQTLYGLNFAKDPIKKQDYSILVEGYLDAIGLSQAGVHNVVASCGTSLTESQVRLMARYSQNIMVNFDPDSAGVSAAERSLNVLLEDGFQIKVLSLPKGNDPDLFIRNFGVEEYRRQLKQAPFYLDYLIEKAREKIHPESSRSKAEALNWLMPYLSRVSNSIERSEMAHKVAEKLVIDDPLVRSELQRAVRERRSQLQKNVTDRGTRLIPAEIQVLQSVFGSENLATELLSFCQSASYYCGLASERIFEAVLSVLKEGGLLEPDGVITRLTEESDREMFMRILYENVEPLTHDHFVNCLDALKRHYLEREKVTLQNQIRDAESRRDVVQLQELLRNQQKLTRQLADLSR